MFCIHCGSQIDDDVIYCDYCGEKVTVNENLYKAKENEEGHNITKITLDICILLLTMGTVASIIDATKLGSDMIYIFGKIILGLILAIGAILIWRSKKIGTIILSIFVPFKMMSSVYYYFQNKDYLLRNLIIDEIFYLAIIIILIYHSRKI